ncbi:type IV pilus modification protein PilV [Niveibacterium sp. SC-1]|uniref:type IV pilus modification protein PilV n=1 Tax=Niveibacterium sp. SC-1 TaxID=3135646 RepID=UPI00311FB886
MNRYQLRRIQRGITMIENMVALLLLSFALLGLAGLLSRTLGRNNESAFHSLAAVEAQDIAERMRTNTIAYGDGVSANTYVAALSSVSSSTIVGTCSQSATNATPTSCTAAQLAADDAGAWRQRLAEEFPSGTGVVCLDDASGFDDGTVANPACSGSGIVVIKIFWAVKNGRASDSSTSQRFTMAFQP